MLVERELLSVQLVWPVGKMRNRKILFMRCYKILAVSYHILTNLPSWGVHCALGNLELWNFQLGWQFNNNSNKVKKGIICSPTEIICTYWVSRRAGWKNIGLRSQYIDQTQRSLCIMTKSQLFSCATWPNSVYKHFIIWPLSFENFKNLVSIYLAMWQKTSPFSSKSTQKFC